MRKGKAMEHCGRSDCSHCISARAMRGHENEDLTTKEIERLFVEAGGVKGNCRPNDHSRRWFKDEKGNRKKWCRPCPRGDGGDSPTHGIGCNGDCHHNPYNVFWSFRSCIGSVDDPNHSHDKPGHYLVVSKLFWCDGTPVDTDS